ncbi:UvrB/UvrC motif-containing protein [Natranaerobius thermophilus]|uniref:UvrB/UvrC protein n=1 Tax=Natranaerobius thermophilus (strain ATCC BAA-1301 / DSM 18059 / JW/NM-WN-LF) TaxID=457570 RepID=B2A489_NATTJ|nr:UvrB/UvrC motif-containing protein [Natranaerobius thermophilus]ACB83743.1 UvrB/UvrC protein [Natranaerobius thermophilus JW/NM-WN-LF]
MMCQNCNKRPATVHWTKIINNKKTEVHLCEKCAKESEQIEFDFENSFPLQNFLSGLMGFDKTAGEGSAQSFHVSADQQGQCETCGLTYQQFGKMGRFGCSNCYEKFGERLKPMLKRIHGSTGHHGKVPKRAGGTLRLKKRISELKEELQRSIHREEFERAAEIRDEIKKLEKELE